MKHLEQLIGSLRDCRANLPDRRTGSNGQCEMADIGLAAFSIFFMQSPSFLAHQRDFENRRGHSNCHTPFGMDKIASDNHIRSMLDAVAPEHLLGQFNGIISHLDEHGGLTPFRRLDGHLPIALDGTEHFTGKKLSCRNCSHRERRDGKKEHFHTMVSAAVVAPGDSRSIPLQSEFVKPRDGHEKQDCERAAIKRRLASRGPDHARLKPVHLGDDLYACHTNGQDQ